MHVETYDVLAQIIKLANWKAAVSDKIQDYGLRSINKRIVMELDN